MATEGRCPVCGEAFEDRPPSCFRCETPLGSWWRLEDELQGLEARPPAGALGPWLLAGTLGLAGLGLAVASWPGPRPAEPPPERSSPAAVPASPSPAPPRRVRYVVQRGDSPWRIAAALTGEGRRWRELFPDPAPVLVPGMPLELPVAEPPGREPR